MLGILFASDKFGETCSVSADVSAAVTKKGIINKLRRAAKVSKDEVQEVFVVKNGDNGVPEIVHHWVGGNGDIT